MDPQIQYFPRHVLEEGWRKAKVESNFEGVAKAIVIYFERIIEVAAPYVAVAKPQMAFYEAYGHWGVWAFERVVWTCKENDLLVIEDAKRCDGGDTAKAYAQGHLGTVDLWSPKRDKLFQAFSFDVDAMTVVPQIGQSCLDPFIKIVKENGKGIFVVDKTSFKPNSAIEQLETKNGLKVWEEIAMLVREWSIGCEGESGINNVGVVVGATYPEEAVRMRKLLPDSEFLVPGYGAQGGGAAGAIAGIRDDGLGVIVNSSRDIDYAYLRNFKCDPKDFAEASRKAAEFSRDDLNAALEEAKKVPW